MTRASFARWVALLCALIVFNAEAGAVRHTLRADLVGVWRLVRIEVRAPQGAQTDPFYGSASEGLLIYDRSGWFSVQIMSGPRPALAVPTTRPQAPGGSTTGAKEGVLDTYYAYYGTWTFDAAASSVTHHARGALYPSELAATYTQRVDVVGNRMTFTRTQGISPSQTVQIKQWERVRTP